MPAFYAHDRFGRKVFARLDGEIKQTIEQHSSQFRIGLQGPDLFFFYKALEGEPGLQVREPPP